MPFAAEVQALEQAPRGCILSIAAGDDPPHAQISESVLADSAAGFCRVALTLEPPVEDITKLPGQPLRRLFLGEVDMADQAVGILQADGEEAVLT